MLLLFDKNRSGLTFAVSSVREISRSRRVFNFEQIFKKLHCHYKLHRHKFVKLHDEHCLYMEAASFLTRLLS